MKKPASRDSARAIIERALADRERLPRLFVVGEAIGERRQIPPPRRPDQNK